MAQSQISLLRTTPEACGIPTFSQSLPYTPTFLIEGQNSKVYQLAGVSPQFTVYDIANTLAASDRPSTIAETLPFLSNSFESFIPVADEDGIHVFSGGCSSEMQDLSLWTYNYTNEKSSWSQAQIVSTDCAVAANFLSGASSFPSPGARNSGIFVFGGMCPLVYETTGSWLTDATYSNSMLSISIDAADTYEVSVIGRRAPPIAQAGHSITPLKPAIIGSSLQQNFVIVGGHTQEAFIDTSLIAIFSLPEDSWAYVSVAQPIDDMVEPRSGHTAVISRDGSKIFIFGGWVGNTTNPAKPQLAILHIGQGFGGDGPWTWTVPDQTSTLLSSGRGIYGHGAVMLPGDIMMVTGGYPILISNSKSVIDWPTSMFYNTTSDTWVSTYNLPLNQTTLARPIYKIDTLHKVLLGVGLGITVLLISVGTCLIWYRCKRQEKRIDEQSCQETMSRTNDRNPNNASSRVTNPSSQTRSSGANLDENGSKQIWYPETTTAATNRSLMLQGNAEDVKYGTPILAHRKTLGILQKNPRSRKISAVRPHTVRMSNIPRIEEEDEEQSQQCSVERNKTLSANGSQLICEHSQDLSRINSEEEAAEQRRQEVREWIEGWTHAAQAMHLSQPSDEVNSRSSSCTMANSTKKSNSSGSVRAPSGVSLKRIKSCLLIRGSSAGTRNSKLPQRSISAGGLRSIEVSSTWDQLSGQPQETQRSPDDSRQSGLDHTLSRRSVSTGDLTELAARKARNSIEQYAQSIGPLSSTLLPSEQVNTVNSPNSHTGSVSDHEVLDDERNCLASPGEKALNAISQVKKRFLTGRRHVSVADRISEIESRSSRSCPTVHHDDLEIAETTRRRVVSSGAEFWKCKRGSKDWGVPESPLDDSYSVRRRSGRGVPHDGCCESSVGSQDTEDWDVDLAFQQRIVQVMFTAPKEKLRVVNADSSSIASDTAVAEGSTETLEVTDPVETEATEDGNGENKDLAKPAQVVVKDDSSWILAALASGQSKTDP